ncbi:MAG: TrpB-like pyridoxal-phosphate dependent enzyme, partial [Bacteroidales bacterium]|nr:TrpB-like pyridoxal-phosphate dependent enzyme [Bacteroidales bacterium]
MRQKKFILPESEIPTAWFNIQAVMPNKPLPILNPATREALKPEDLYPIFCEECANQELNVTDEWIP